MSTDTRFLRRETRSPPTGRCRRTGPGGAAVRVNSYNPHPMRTTTPLRAALCLMAGAFLLAGCDRGGKSTRPRVAYVTNGIDSFWVIAKAGAEAGAKKYDADVEVQMPAQGVADQKRIVEDLLTRGVDGIAISPIDAENETALINEAARRTRLITQDSDAPKSNRLCFIGGGDHEAGRPGGDVA